MALRPGARPQVRRRPALGILGRRASEGPGGRRARGGDRPVCPGRRERTHQLAGGPGHGPRGGSGTSPQPGATLRFFSVPLSAAELQQWPPSSCARPAARRPAPARRWAGLPPNRGRRRHSLAALGVVARRPGQRSGRPGAAFPGGGRAGRSRATLSGAVEARLGGANPGAAGRCGAVKGRAVISGAPTGKRWLAGAGPAKVTPEREARLGSRGPLGLGSPAPRKRGEAKLD